MMHAMTPGETQSTHARRENKSVPRADTAGRPKWVTLRDSPLVVLSRARTLVRQEGLRGLLSAAMRSVTDLRQRVYSESLLRLYHLSLPEAAAISSKPPMEGLNLRVIESADDAVQLAVAGFENILETVPRTGLKLNAGAVATCVFLGRELVSIDWMAFSDEAKRVVDPFPYRVDFSAGETWTAGAFTVRRLRGRGIAAYRFSGQVRYMLARGCHVCYNAIAVNNIPSQRTVERYGATFNEVFRRRRICGRSSYTQVWSREGTAEATAP